MLSFIMCRFQVASQLARDIELDGGAQLEGISGGAWSSLE